MLKEYCSFIQKVDILILLRRIYLQNQQLSCRKKENNCNLERIVAREYGKCSCSHSNHFFNLDRPQMPNSNKPILHWVASTLHAEVWQLFRKQTHSCLEQNCNSNIRVLYTVHCTLYTVHCTVEGVLHQIDETWYKS